MANANSTVRNDIKTPLDALDSLNHAVKMTTFLQDVLTLNADEGLPENLDTTGLYFIFNDIQDRIIAANIVFNNHLKINEFPAVTANETTVKKAKTFLHRNNRVVFFKNPHTKTYDQDAVISKFEILSLALEGILSFSESSVIEPKEIESIAAMVSSLKKEIIGQVS